MSGFASSFLEVYKKRSLPTQKTAREALLSAGLSMAICFTIAKVGLVQDIHWGQAASLVGAVIVTKQCVHTGILLSYLARYPSDQSCSHNHPLFSVSAVVVAAIVMHQWAFYWGSSVDVRRWVGIPTLFMSGFLVDPALSMVHVHHHG